MPGHAQALIDDDPTSLVGWEAEFLQNWVCHHTRRPHEGVGVVLGSIGKHQMPIDRGGEARLEANVDPATPKMSGGIGRKVAAYLRQDRRAGFDQNPLHVCGCDAGVVARRIAGEVLEFGEGFDPRVAAADERERQGPLPGPRVGGGLSDVEPGQHPVPQVDGLLHGSEANRPLRQPRNVEDARHGAQADHEVVVGLLPLGSFLRLQRGAPRRVIDTHDPAGDDPGALQGTSQRNDNMARFDASRSCLRQERLIGHIAVGSDHGDLVVTAELLLEPEGGIETHVATAGDQYPRHQVGFAPALGRSMIRWRSAPVISPTSAPSSNTRARPEPASFIRSIAPVSGSVGWQMAIRVMGIATRSVRVAVTAPEASEPRLP